MKAKKFVLIYSKQSRQNDQLKALNKVNSRLNKMNSRRNKEIHSVKTNSANSSAMIRIELSVITFVSILYHNWESREKINQSELQHLD